MCTDFISQGEVCILKWPALISVTNIQYKYSIFLNFNLSISSTITAMILFKDLFSFLKEWCCVKPKIMHDTDTVAGPLPLGDAIVN